MNRRCIYFSLLCLIYCFLGCTTTTTYSKPAFSEDLDFVTTRIKNLSKAESVDFVDISSTQNDVVLQRELRIDLVKPAKFPDQHQIKNIILNVKSMLIDSSAFSKFTLNEVDGQYGYVTIFPAEKILKSVSINAQELR